MPYSQFTLRKVKEAFQLTLIEDQAHFASVSPQALSAELANILRENVPLALAINTEKARSELIIAPILVELRKLFDRQISLFSGIDFVVDASQDLNGFCDFMLSRSPEQLFLTAPVVAIVEAKNEDLVGGLGQCVAEMVAAQLFNRQEKNELAWVYGTVTTGSTWKFLKLQHQTVWIDNREYHIEQSAKLIGILVAMINQQA